MARHQCNCEVIARTKYGKIMGLSETYVNSSTPFKVVKKFLGIPFAAPPTGKLRFRPPQTPSPWKPDIYNASQFKSPCLQLIESGTILFYKNFWPKFNSKDYSEDCLYLNIYVPAENHTISVYRESSGFPVMLYIHGGGYEVGSPVASPGDQLALRGVVVVTIQYRLNAFGFVTTGSSAAPGNYGMLDQVAALKWVHENIAAFGGNPLKVTIFGESAGGSSVALHILSPLSRDYFHQAISISGVDFSPFSYSTLTAAVNFTRQIAQTVNCTIEDNARLVDCLRSVDARKIPVDGFNTWRPVIDRTFLMDSPRQLRKQGNFSKVPFMAGFTKNEGSYFVPNLKSKLHLSHFTNEIKRALKFISNYNFDLPGTANSLIMAALEFQYLPRPQSNHTPSLEQNLYDIVTDYSFAAPTHAVLFRHTDKAQGFMYQFQYNSSSQRRPMSHLSDIPYIFGLPFANFIDKNSREAFNDQDRNISNTIITLFTNFAKYGHPTPSPVHGTVWKEFNSVSKKYLSIKTELNMAAFFEPERMAFWNEYYPKLLELIDKDFRVKEQENCSSSAPNVAISCLGILIIPTLILVLFYNL